MYILSKEVLEVSKARKCHKHLYNETCGISWFLKRIDIIFLFLLSFLFVKQDVKHGKNNLRDDFLFMF